SPGASPAKRHQAIRSKWSYRPFCCSTYFGELAGNELAGAWREKDRCRVSPIFYVTLTHPMKKFKKQLWIGLPLVLLAVAVLLGTLFLVFSQSVAPGSQET